LDFNQDKPGTPRSIPKPNTLEYLDYVINNQSSIQDENKFADVIK
jgi:hypothetical protein